MSVTHQSLVAVAARWLQKKHAIVITELATTGEEPDAIGWCGTHSTLVECKISRADFNADKGKMFRREPAYGIGQHRYFLTVPGIINQEELPPKWGLLELNGDRVKVIRESECFDEVNLRHEIGILLSTIRRIGKDSPENMSIKFYTFETKNRATLGVGTPLVKEWEANPNGDRCGKHLDGTHRCFRPAGHAGDCLF